MLLAFESFRLLGGGLLCNMRHAGRYSRHCQLHLVDGCTALAAVQLASQQRASQMVNCGYKQLQYSNLGTPTAASPHWQHMLPDREGPTLSVPLPTYNCSPRTCACATFYYHVHPKQQARWYEHASHMQPATCRFGMPCRNPTRMPK